MLYFHIPRDKKIKIKIAISARPLSSSNLPWGKTLGPQRTKYIAEGREKNKNKAKQVFFVFN